MLRTVVYIRKSSDDDEDKQKNSWDRQKADIFNFLEKYNSITEPSEQLIILDKERDIIYEDESAKKPGRPKFNVMISNINKGRYDVLLCTELSRLSRNALDTGTLTHIMDDEKLIQIRTIDKVFGTSPTDKFTLTLFLSVAKYENDQRGINTSSGMQLKKSRGSTTNKAPMGYINNPDGNKKGDKEVGPDNFNDNFRLLKELWRKIASGNYLVSEIYQIGKSKGITIVDGKGERRIPVESTYRSMFNSKYYLGLIEQKDKKNGTETWIEGKHPAMVDEETFNQVQLILQKRGSKHSPTTKDVTYDKILKELLVCGKSNEKMYLDRKERYTCSRCKHRFSSSQIKPCPKCGNDLTPEAIKKVETHRYYVCPKGTEHTYFYKGETKTSRNIVAEYIEQLVDKEIAKISISEGLYNVLRKQLYTLWLERNKDIKESKNKLKERIEKYDTKRMGYRDKLISDSKDMDELEKKDMEIMIERCKLDIQDLNIQIEELNENIENDFDKTWETLNVMFETKQIFGSKNNISLEPKRKLLLSLCTNQTFTDGKIFVNRKKPFDVAINMNLTKKKSQVGLEISGSDSYWLPRLDSNQRPNG